jgi:predicted alpha/beta superfamily hydrolase
MTPADDARPAPTHSPTSFPGAVEFDTTSEISCRTYRIFVYQPPVPPPQAGYPAVFLSDGNMNFPIAAAMGAMFAFQGAPALIVGVGYRPPIRWS